MIDMGECCCFTICDATQIGQAFHANKKPEDFYRNTETPFINVTYRKLYYIKNSGLFSILSENCEQVAVLEIICPRIT